MIITKSEFEDKWFMFRYVKMIQTLNLRVKNQFQNKKLQILTSNKIISENKINYIQKQPNLS